MEQNTRPYALALLELWGNQQGANENPPLGWASRWETRSSTYNFAAHRLLRALIENPPSQGASQVVSRQFLTLLLRSRNSDVIDLVNPVLNNGSPIIPANWAEAVFNALSRTGDISPLTKLAASFLNNLVIPIVNPPGRTTPTDLRAQDHPDTTHGDNNPLPQSAGPSRSRRNQVTLKDHVLRRDGPQCLITGTIFAGDTGTTVPSYCAHIIPFSIHNKTAVHSAIEMFTGKEVRATDVLPFINHPRNAINLESNAHVALDMNLAWGIEAVLVSDNWRYFYRIVRPTKVYSPMRLQDGDQLVFGMGDDGNSIALPDPRLCNLHLAIARVYAASGFAEIVDQYINDLDDDEGAQAVPASPNPLLWLKSSLRKSLHKLRKRKPQNPNNSEGGLASLFDVETM